MKILQLHARYRVRAGEDTVVDHEAAALTEAGHDVRQCLVENPAGTAASVRALAASLHNRSIARRVRDEVADFEPDVVHVHNTWFAMSSSAITAASSTGTPVVLTLHNFRLGCLSTDLYRDGQVCTDCLGRRPFPGVRHGCYRGSRVLSAVQAAEIVSTRARGVLDDGVTRFVAPSQFMADRLGEVGVPVERLVVKPHFVVDPGARVLPPSESDTLLAVGRLAPGKGLDHLLEAWRRLDLSGPTKRLVVIGDGPLAADLAARAPASVDFVGWLDAAAVRRRLLDARALVAPSELYETFGMVLAEALSAGLPTVVTDAAGAADLTGAAQRLVVPAGDADALADAIAGLDDATVDAEGARGRARYEDRYSVSTGVANLESLYRDAIAARGASRD